METELKNDANLCSNCGGTAGVSEVSLLDDRQRRWFDADNPPIGAMDIRLCAPCAALLDLLLCEHPDLKEDFMMLVQDPLEFDREEARRYALYLLANGYFWESRPWEPEN